MSQRMTGGYDAFVALTQSGLNRLVASTYMEEFANLGLPYPFSESNQFHLLTHLPRVQILPNRNALEFILPFTESRLNNVTGLNGSLFFILPFTGTADDGTFGFNLALLEAGLELDADDAGSNPTDMRPSSERIAALDLINGQLTNEFSQNPPEALQTLTDHPALAFLLQPARCPATPDNAELSAIPVFLPPALVGFSCLDAEIRTNTERLILMKAKLSDRSAGTGIVSPPGAAPVNWVTAGTELGLMIGNRFLLEEILPSPLMDFLLQIDRPALHAQAESEVNNDTIFTENVRTDIRAEVLQEAGNRGQTISETEISRRVNRLFKDRIKQLRQDEASRRFEETLEATVTAYFAFPFVQLAPIGMRLPLPTLKAMVANPDNPVLTVPGPDDPPNITVFSSNLGIPTGANHVTLQLHVSVRMSDYSFTADIEIGLWFTHHHDRLRVAPEIKKFEMGWTSFSNIISNGLRHLAGSIILTGLSKVFSEPVAAESMAETTSTAMAGIRFRELEDLMFMNQVFLDDLQLNGAIRIGHTTQQSRGMVTEGNCIDREEEFVTASGSVSLTLTDGGPVVALVENGRIKPTGSALLLNLGPLPRYQAANLSQADLRAPESATLFTDAEIPLPGINPLNDHMETQVAVVALRTEAGQHALINANRDLSGHLVILWRVYRQIIPGLYLTLHPLQAQTVSAIDIESFYDGPEALVHRPVGDCEVDLANSRSENVDVPSLVGPGEVVTGSIKVGVDASECTFSATAIAVPVLLRQPLGQYVWSVILENGTVTPIQSGVPLNIDVSPAGQPANTVIFTIDAQQPHLCHIQGQKGRSVSCKVKVTLNEREYPGHPAHAVGHEAEVQINYRGRILKSYGYDQWLDIFNHSMKNLGIGLDPDLTNPGHEIDPSPVADHGRIVNVVNLREPAGEIIRLDPSGRRGVLTRDLESSRTVPYELSGTSAREYLESYVTTVLGSIPASQRRQAGIAQWEQRVTKWLGDLPDPGKI
ncbi:MAG: hypothetical protein ACFCUM_10275 [Bacteroidales bacterium]